MLKKEREQEADQEADRRKQEDMKRLQEEAAQEV